MKPAVMPPRRRTSAILFLAAGVAAGAALLTPRGAPPEDPPPASSLLSARSTSTHVLRGMSETHIAVTVRAPELAEARERPPVSLSIVIDRSGSMEGKPLADAKAAARHLVERLGPRDRVAIVTYSTGAELIVPLSAAGAAGRAHALQMIDGIDSNGGTNISQGIELGSEALAPARASDGLRRLVLISDGQANEGLVDPERLAELAAATAAGGTAITSVGVGLDFDERTMSAIAIAGRGRYHFVEDTGQIAALFERELGDLAMTVASDAELVVTAAPGVEVLDAFGYHPYRSRGATIVPLADLRSGEVRKIVLRVRVTTAGAGRMDLATMMLAWRPRDQARAVVASTQVAVAITDDTGAVLANRDREIVRQVEAVETAAAVEAAADAYERGDHGAAGVILDRRAAAASQTSLEIGDDDLAREVQAATGKAKRKLARPAADESERKRALKSNRADAYEMRY
jgi:Ca-activated chloride channel family protein